MNKQSLLVVIFLLLISTLIFTGCGISNKKETTSTYLDDQSQPLIENFFKSVQSGNFKVAVNELLSNNENIDLRDSVTINLQVKFNYINEQSGRYVSKRLLKEKKLNNDLGVYSYLVIYEKKFYRFNFIFYNNGTVVKIFKFSFDDTIDNELEEAIKLYVN